ncbi:ring-exported protein (REX), putative [Plasmodium ovale wallikeri]|uniref:Ring-exported protein (REX), putative n=1 Tax=Plasmodium ovale wallikeri TaxID=864142 RepID=A0A1A8YM94_PLAOA|nr:ring-exported protein (REX), putative [Plasmodium ovale wallikeri]
MNLRSYILLSLSVAVVLSIYPNKQYDTSEGSPFSLKRFLRLKGTDNVNPNQDLSTPIFSTLKGKWNTKWNAKRDPIVDAKMDEERKKKIDARRELLFGDKRELLFGKKQEEHLNEKREVNLNDKREVNLDNKGEINLGDKIEKKKIIRDGKSERIPLGPEPLNYFNFEAKIDKEWKELENKEYESWESVLSGCRMALAVGLDSDPKRDLKIERWNNKQKALSIMRRVKNKVDRRNVQAFKEHLQKRDKSKPDNEPWKIENDKWTIIKYLKTRSDENWNNFLIKSWTQWFDSEIPEVKFEVFL